MEAEEANWRRVFKQKKKRLWSRESHQPGTCWFLISNAVQKITHAKTAFALPTLVSLELGAGSALEPLGHSDHNRSHVCIRQPAWAVPERHLGWIILLASCFWQGKKMPQRQMVDPAAEERRFWHCSFRAGLSLGLLISWEQSDLACSATGTQLSHPNRICLVYCFSGFFL